MNIANLRTTIRASTAFLLLMPVVSLLMAARPSFAEPTHRSCLAWEVSQRGQGEVEERTIRRLPIDRLAPSVPYDRLLYDFEADGCMRLNYVQAIGTHNSYHVAPSPPLLQFIKSLDPAFAASIDNTKASLSNQLNLGVRQLELDVFADPAGGRFALPLGALAFGPTSADPATAAQLRQPGLKVLHAQDVDFATTCVTFRACLSQVKAWSDANPRHLPLMILVEAKDAPLAVPPNAIPAGLPVPVQPIPFDRAQLAQVDAEILSVFPASQLITPDAVRGTRISLEEAVLKDGWPTLNEARGRIMFALDNTDAKRDLYVDGFPSLRGRVMFTNSSPGRPEAAFVEMNNPIGNERRIAELVTKGYLVRTRADENTAEARLGATERREAAIASGAQFVSTDYPVVDPHISTTYSVRLPNGREFRCNPVLSPPACKD